MSIETNRIIHTVLTLLAGLLSQVDLVQSASPPADPMAASAQALGGREKLAAIKTIYTRTRLELRGMTGTVENWSSAQGELRQHVKLGGVMEALTVFDGSAGWMKDHNQHVLALEGSELQSTVTSAFLESFSDLLPGRMKGEVQKGSIGESADLSYVVKPEGGSPVTIHLDAVTHLPVRQQRREGAKTVTVTFDDWREVEGVKFPFRFRQSSGDTRFDVTATVEEIRVNTPFASDLFSKPVESSVAIRFTAPHGRAEIPVEFVNNHIYLPVRVNASEPLAFILDTGAEVTALDKGRAKALGIETHGMLEAQGAGGSTDVAIVKGLTFSLPGVELVDQTAAAIDLDALAPFEGQRIDGVLGYEVFRQCIVEIDYGGGKVILYDPARHRYDGAGILVPFTFSGKTPQVKMSLVFPDATVEGMFVIDTGSRGSVTVNSNITAPTSFGTAAHRTLCGVGVGGESFCRLGRATSLRLGPSSSEPSSVVELSAPLVGFSEDTRGSMADPDRAGLIGGEVLRRFRVIFDYAGKRVWLERDNRCTESMEWDMSGLWLTAQPPHFKIFRVHRVMDDSPASRAGVQVGDLITGMDGRSTAEFALSEFRDLLRAGPRTVTLQLERNGQAMEVKLNLRRQL
jgi:hypothetical protein